jgi:predicted DNA-binding antitoxin AbrB/MazE fold protein
MSLQVDAIYENGVLRPLVPLALREQERVSVSIDRAEEAQSSASAPERTLFDVLNDAGLVGCISSGPVDLSTNPKHLEGMGERAR